MIPPKDELSKEFSEVCRKLGWKQTASRFAVYKYLHRNTEHPKVEDAWKAIRKDIPAISKTSVFRILEDFVARGLIVALDLPDSVARYDANPQRHDHFFCVQCGRFFDLDISDVDEAVSSASRKIGKIERFETRVRGICFDCLKRNQNIKTQNESKDSLSQINHPDQTLTNEN